VKAEKKGGRPIFRKKPQAHVGRGEEKQQQTRGTRLARPTLGKTGNWHKDVPNDEEESRK